MGDPPIGDDRADGVLSQLLKDRNPPAYLQVCRLRSHSNISSSIHRARMANGQARERLLIVARNNENNREVLCGRMDVMT